MENPEEILHSLEEFAKLRPKDIPRELEEYLCFVAKTGDPVYQWSSIKSLFREKLINVITEFYESCPSIDIPPCPNVDVFNYEIMKNFILEKLDTFAAAPFTVQRICELLTTPRKEYNRIDKYMRALEKNILVVSTTEPGNRRSTENGENVMNGIDSENGYETNNSNSDINVEEMDDVPSWPRASQNESTSYQSPDISEPQTSQPVQIVQETFISESSTNENACTSTGDTVITKNNEPYVSIEPIASDDTCNRQESSEESNVSVTITAIPAAVQKRRDSIEPVVSSEQTEQVSESASSSSEAELLNITESEKVSHVIKSDLEPLINVDSTITTTETEINTPTCSDTTDTLIERDDTVDSQVDVSLHKENEVEVPTNDANVVNNSENNFVIKETVGVETTTANNEEITTSEIQENNETIESDDEPKDNIITSSDTIDNVTTAEEYDNKIDEIIKDDNNEAESTLYSTEDEQQKQQQQEGDAEQHREQARTESPTKEEIVVEENVTLLNKDDEETDETNLNELVMEVDVDEQTRNKNEDNLV